jgi:hypothetical protein
VKQAKVAKAIRVFVSYSHDSDEHSGQVSEFSNKLREWGIDSRIDQYEPAPAEGWPTWMQRQIRAASFIIVICSKEYRKRFEAKIRARGKGARFEGSILTTEIYESLGNNRRIIPVVLHDKDQKQIPTILRIYTFYNVGSDDGFENLYRHLTNQLKRSPAPLGQIRTLLTDTAVKPALVRQTLLGTPVDPSRAQNSGLFRELILRSPEYRPPMPSSDVRSRIVAVTPEES